MELGDHGDRDCKLGYCWGIFSPHSLGASLDGERVFIAGFVDGAAFASQLDGRGDGRERVCNRVNFDTVSPTVETCPDPRSKTGDDDVCFELWEVLEEWVDATDSGICAPVFPVSLSIFLSRSNDPSVDALPRTQEITRDVMSDGRWNSCQDFA